ncbi:hypothetical protein GGR57DRAFT_466160 [Xylariaceae sp. FL1272]|nr:hypothetical protein GGR57DRAFT_466160 [Xylariaceae sp. FL1272]
MRLLKLLNLSGEVGCMIPPQYPHLTNICTTQIIVIIASQFTLKDLIRLRLTCKALGALTFGPFANVAFRRLHVGMNRRDITKLDTLSRSRFQSSVKELFLHPRLEFPGESPATYQLLIKAISRLKLTVVDIDHGPDATGHTMRMFFGVFGFHFPGSRFFPLRSEQTDFVVSLGQTLTASHTGLRVLEIWPQQVSDVTLYMNDTPQLWISSGLFTF